MVEHLSAGLLINLNTDKAVDFGSGSRCECSRSGHVAQQTTQICTAHQHWTSLGLTMRLAVA